MKRVAILCIVALALLVVSGCCGAGLDEEFVRAVDANWKVIGPDYRAYLEKDADLSAQSKAIRLRAVDEFSRLVADAKADVEGKGGGN